MAWGRASRLGAWKRAQLNMALGGLALQRRGCRVAGCMGMRVHTSFIIMIMFFIFCTSTRPGFRECSVALFGMRQCLDKSFPHAWPLCGQHLLSAAGYE